MDSLPDQRIEALPGATRQEAYWKIQAVCLLRSRRTLSEDEIAKRAQFGTAEAMHHQLKTWGLTGLLPPEKQDETPKPKAAEVNREQKARNSGPPEELPAAYDAADLLRGALDQLREHVEMLEHLSLVYQGGRFAGTYTFEGSWASEEQDGDASDVEIVYAPDAFRAPTEAGPYPPRELVALIAAYALAGRPMEPLLEALYPTYSQTDLEEIHKHLYETKSPRSRDGLLRTAQQFAAAAYGRRVGRGAAPEQPAGDHLLACYITLRREAGATDEEIHQEILNTGRELSMEDFARLAKLERRFPSP
jgi:hypothetical protein